MHKKTVWMNVTTSANWRGPAVGIVRVEQSLCTELAELFGTDFKRCIWNGSDFEIYKQPLSSHRNSPQTPRAQRSIVPLPEHRLAFPLLSKREAIIAIAQGFLSLTPSFARPTLNRLLCRTRPIVLGFLSKAKSVRDAHWKLTKSLFGRGNFTNNTNHTIGKIFSADDIFISVGLDWEHSFYGYLYFLRKIRHVKVVSCCYDLIPVLFPQYCVGDVAAVFTSYFLDLADGSDLILCISKQSEKDLLSLLDITGGNKPNTQVFPLGDNVPNAEHGSISDPVRNICEQSFILYVSSIERRKNHEVLYRAYHLLAEEGKLDGMPKLVFVGMQGWGVSDLMKDIKLDPLIKNYIVLLNGISDNELRALYDASLFCVFPSFYEGWGLPVGEALSLGKVVIASAQGSLPEVGGDLVEYVDPWNTRAWSYALQKMALDDEWRAAQEQRIRKNYCPRTWADAGHVIHNALKRLST